MNNLDTKPQTAAVNSLPEFADYQTAKRLFSLSRSYLYQLVDERKIRSVSLRKKGALKGRRLFDCASIRQYINSKVEEAE
jgi:hypothetical protein